MQVKHCLEWEALMPAASWCAVLCKCTCQEQHKEAHENPASHLLCDVGASACLDIRCSCNIWVDTEINKWHSTAAYSNLVENLQTQQLWFDKSIYSWHTDANAMCLTMYTKSVNVMRAAQQQQ